MRVAVVGAGAIGGPLAEGLARGGAETSVIARGAHLAAIRENGIRIERGGETRWARVRATDDPATLPVQDFVLLAVKAHALAEAATASAPLIGPETAVVTVQNGIPWWYFHRFGGPYDGRRLVSVDPDGAIEAAVPGPRVLGGVVYLSGAVAAPGLVRRGAGDRVVLGEPDGTMTPRLEAFRAALAAGGFEAQATPRIRDEVWMKLTGNVSFSLIAVLTTATLGTLATDPACRALAYRVMEEVRATGEAAGARFAMTIEQRMAITARSGGHKTSILQDLEAGRTMEIDVMGGSAVEMARLLNVPAPFTEMLYRLARQRAREAGLYPENKAMAALI